MLGSSRSKMVDLLVQNGAQGAAVVSLVLLFAAGTTGRLVGVAAGLVALGLVAWLLRRSEARRPELLGAYVGARLVLLVAVAGALLARRPEDPVWIWLGTGVALLAVLAESTLRSMLTKTATVAVNLPGVPTVPEPPFPTRTLPWMTLGVTALGWLLALLAAPGWLHLVAGLLALATAAALLVHAGRANLVARRAARGLRKALVAHQPAFVVYYATVQGARYQLGMWLPYLERLGVPFVVITRVPETVPVIASLTSAPVLVPRKNSTVGTLDQLVVPSMKAAFYVQGSAANSFFQRYRQLTHVWLNHGDSDKAANFSARHATYDKLFVSGQQGVERYAAHGVHVPPERFVVVGRPQVERIEVHDEPLPADAPRTVLYAPTWRGGRPATNYSSLPLAEQVVEALLARGATVVFRPHPLSYNEPEDAAVIHRVQQQLAADQAATGRAHVWGPAAETDRDIPACINAVDALVTDVSSVASDFLASGKPLAMVAIRTSGSAFTDEFPMARVSYVIEKDLSTLDGALGHLLGDDPLRERRLAYRHHCLGDHLGAHAADEFLRVAGAIVRGQR
ncbi:CDP-Glycerol:Poly(glycerophosphate) glycerophosphotransferase [Friedmanniella luteola]|uniref:CDP-Glycerol:Poly(Glycerophosphate) glycerophosphotransferase n=1 Tax=Friedmanniella luteola TaxID=546871 RepID=A0A1H1ZRK1_9ACTN|nr:CDP-Glycerol:Poly(glycerophosphate) glycerophosphotransferase [Friedmanniella luteola]